MRESGGGRCSALARAYYPGFMTRRELLASLGAAVVAQRAHGAETPVAPVSIGRCRSYDQDLPAVLEKMFDQLGGLGRIVRNRTVTVKLNLTGTASSRFREMAPTLTHVVHPSVVMALVQLLEDAGARRVRLAEGCGSSAGPLEGFLGEFGFDVKALAGLSRNLEFVNTNVLGDARQYARLKVPAGATLFPAYDLHPVYEQTDVFVSLAKLKYHAVAGVTLALKNCFGIAPASIYSDDAGVGEPNEEARQWRGSILHNGRRAPSGSAPQELDPKSPREAGYRVPRIVAELVAARPVDLCLIDGVQTVAGGEGPWISGLRTLSPGLLIAGTNPVSTDAVAAAVMGYDPRAPRGVEPFLHGDNALILAEKLGIGSTDLKRIEVRGLSIQEALCRFS